MLTFKANCIITFIYTKEYTKNILIKIMSLSFTILYLFYIPQYRILDEDKDAKETKEQEAHQEQQVVDGE